MKRYGIFGYEHGAAQGGMQDFIDTVATLEELKIVLRSNRIIKSLANDTQGFGIVQVWDFRHKRRVPVYRVSEPEEGCKGHDYYWELVA